MAVSDTWELEQKERSRVEASLALTIQQAACEGDAQLEEGELKVGGRGGARTCCLCLLVPAVNHACCRRRLPRRHLAPLPLHCFLQVLCFALKCGVAPCCDAAWQRLVRPPPVGGKGKRKRMEPRLSATSLALPQVWGVGGAVGGAVLGTRREPRRELVPNVCRPLGQVPPHCKQDAGHLCGSHRARRAAEPARQAAAAGGPAAPASAHHPRAGRCVAAGARMQACTLATLAPATLPL